MRLLPRCAAIALPLLASCASSSGFRDPWASDGTWVYGICRDLYPSKIDNARDDGGAVTFPFLFVFPFAVDTLLLPVTVPHDLLFVE